MANLSPERFPLFPLFCTCQHESSVSTILHQVLNFRYRELEVKKWLHISSYTLPTNTPVWRNHVTNRTCSVSPRIGFLLTPWQNHQPPIPFSNEGVAGNLNLRNLRKNLSLESMTRQSLQDGAREINVFFVSPHHVFYHISFRSVFWVSSFAPPSPTLVLSAHRYLRNTSQLLKKSTNQRGVHTCASNAQKRCNISELTLWTVLLPRVVVCHFVPLFASKHPILSGSALSMGWERWLIEFLSWRNGTLEHLPPRLSAVNCLLETSAHPDQISSFTATPVS